MYTMPKWTEQELREWVDERRYGIQQTSETKVYRQPVVKERVDWLKPKGSASSRYLPPAE